ncbi:MAG TPA: DUF1330 domain-containing protein [Alphaproteobacteria bacterium]|jgi:uncharacterized protein (DUF1330 family)|nr:DUF1330 domain-containing protein [Alphaproteobacteria bacterium]
MSEAGPSADVLGDLAEHHTGPIVIMNLLKFKEDAGDGRTGRQAYADYGALAAEILPVYGAEVVWTGRQMAVIAGGAQDDWDVVLLVRYPSVGALARMSASPEYRAIYHHRTAALARETVTALAEDFALGD